MARLVTLDVTNTCIKVVHSVGYHYAQVVKNYGVILNNEDVDKKFRKAFKDTNSSFPCFGKEHNFTSRQWWQKVVDKTLLDCGLKDKGLMNTIGLHLYEDFSGSRNWQVFPDVIPSLINLKSAGVLLGAISNFDDRLYGILKSLDIAKYFDFVLAAYEVSVAKPDVRIFELALNRASVMPREAIHVGDNYELDYLAARNAGMRSLLLVRNRDAQHHTEECDEKPVTISSISQVLHYL